jgi:ribose transport system ATP-binding protein
VAPELIVATMNQGLVIRNLSKAFTGVRALKGVTLALVPGQVHALVGHNGSGKTTLIKVLCGYYTPDSGTLTVDDKDAELGNAGIAARLGIAFVHQDLSLIPNLSVSENLALVDSGSGRGPIRRKQERFLAEEALRRTGYWIDVDTQVAALGPAERTGVALARALGTRDRQLMYLVLDEPTAALPRDGVVRLFRAIRELTRQGVGVLFVSHHLHEVLEIGDQVTVLRDGAVVDSQPRGAFSHGDLVRLVGGVPPAISGPAMEAPGPLVSCEEPLLRVSALAGKSVERLTFEVRRGEVLGFAGVVGSGREDVLPMIYGTLPRSGRVRAFGCNRPVPPGRTAAAKQAGIGMLPADRRAHSVFPELSMRDNMFVNDRKYRGRPRRIGRRDERQILQSWIDALKIKPQDTEVPIGQASGGNQQKLVLARALRDEPQILLLDEPTQGVDIGAVRVIHGIVKDYAQQGHAVLVASSDEEELVELCDRVIALRDGASHDELAGAALRVPRLVAAVLGA